MAKTKPRRYDIEYRTFQGTKEQLKNRAKRNAARRLMERELGEITLRGKDIAHLNDNPHDNSRDNLRVMSRKKNRSKK